ncbi:DUF1934 domain-containing protein [Clostridium intestinale]|uniref:Uncharacterized beta-barrel protein YwiB, DUF1934 family n=1 Tax=Clostridium intestinale DSM 6191 TaxID=1121320 RepID=A0A1M6DAY4_9CLOT|nr:DUF1934 domain-containing protein [Clostridium intestinale]SHI70416.1 Uncharacterized beta-barrel protein YwiB, DUF1934 family [Clostridium intestinale DSM 6191]
MKKKALISIISNQNYEDDDVIEVVTPGEFYINNDGYEAIYEETEISGMEGTTTKLKIFGNEISLEREGTTTTKMDFKKNNNYITLYNTPYGMLELKINTKNLKIDMSDDGGEVQIDYNLSISGQPPQETQLKIKINSTAN